MEKDRIDQKLTELYNALTEFKGIGDRTKAIEDLAKRLSEVGEAQIMNAEERLTMLCQSVIDAVKSGIAIPEKIAQASASLDEKTVGGIRQLEDAASVIDKNVSDVVSKIDNVVQSLRTGAIEAGEELEKKLAIITTTGSLADFSKLDRRLQDVEGKIGVLEGLISDIRQLQNSIVEAHITSEQKQADIKVMLTELKSMVEKIPTKRGLFG